MKCKIIHNGKLHEFANLEIAQNYLDKNTSIHDEVEIINAPHLFILLNAKGAPITNWREIHDEICNEWGRIFQNDLTEEDYLNTKQKREALLSAYSSTMDAVESITDSDSLAILIEARDKVYKTFIYQESMIGENLCVETLFKVTQREINAGRMKTDHSCRLLAEKAMASPHPTRAELIREKNQGSVKDSDSKKGLIYKLKRWLQGN